MTVLADVTERKKTMKIVDPDSGEVTNYVECISCEGCGRFEIYYNEFDSYDEVCRRCLGDGIVEESSLSDKEKELLE